MSSVGHDISNARDKILELLRLKYQNSQYNNMGYLTLFADMILLLYQDILYNVDFNYNEYFVTSAVSIRNIIKQLEDRGIKLKFVYPAVTYTEISFVVPAESSNGSIDTNYMPIIRAGTTIGDDVKFELLDDVNTKIVFDKLDIKQNEIGDNGQVLNYKVTIPLMRFVAGETVVKRVNISNVNKYHKVELVDNDIIDIIDVTDEEGNVYYKVDSLAQDFIFNYVKYSEPEFPETHYELNCKHILYKFICRHINNNTVELIFGNSYNDNSFYDTVVNPYNVFENIKDNYYSNNENNVINSLDSLMRVNSLGILPKAGNLYIKYRKGGGPASNVDINTLTSFDKLIVDIFVDDIDKANDVRNSFTVKNITPGYGGSYLTDDIDRLKFLATSGIFSQNRCITKEDYIYKLYMMSDKIGKVAANVNINNNIVDIYVAGHSDNRTIVKTSDVFKEDIKEYLYPYAPTNVYINVYDADIVELSVSIDINLNVDADASITLQSIIDSLYNYIYWQDKAQPFVVSKIYDVIHNFKEVLSVSNIKLDIVNKNELSELLSKTGFNVYLNKNNKYYVKGRLHFPEYCLWQLRKENININI